MTPCNYDFLEKGVPCVVGMEVYFSDDGVGAVVEWVAALRWGLSSRRGALHSNRKRSGVASLMLPHCYL
ncbi:hypothetical protein DQ04_02271040 [Trypanosoma grayi]|uniref:hypothetical protein n=1 Tax=Trypanosoma grayi TaxID=71804 RepID=UPI0004F3F2B2|nr:hypothetical protein DQ04_02271040 [Trypanosoma grayi]KEG11794.1 hypothetical protein DQ04_02271040 [Trypanosoma grayi]